jgi:hypothetical protein
MGRVTEVPNFCCRHIWGPTPPPPPSWDMQALPATHREDRIRYIQSHSAVIDEGSKGLDPNNTTAKMVYLFIFTLTTYQYRL